MTRTPAWSSAYRSSMKFETIKFTCSRMYNFGRCRYRGTVIGLYLNFGYRMFRLTF